MDIGISTTVAMAKRKKRTAWLAEQLNISNTNASRVANSQHAGSRRIAELAEIFGMSVTDFIALGE